jgi:hypothetical protein
MPTRLCVLVLLAACAASAADPAFGFLPPDSGMIMGFNIARIRATPFARDLSAQLKWQIGSLGAPASPAALALFNGIDGVTIAIAQVSDNRGLVVIRGTFSRGAYEEWVRPQEVSTALVRGVRVTTISSAQNVTVKNPAVAFLDSGLILGGDAASVSEAIARRARPGAIVPALARKAGELSALHDLWLVARVPAEGLTRQAASSPQLQRALAIGRSIEQVSLGLNIGAKLDLDVELVARTAEDANAMANGLRLLMTMAASGQDQQSKSLAGLLQQADLRPEGKLIRVSLSLTQEQLKQLRLGGGATGAAAPPKVNPNEIVIQSSPKDMGTVKIIRH